MTNLTILKKHIHYCLVIRTRPDNETDRVVLVGCFRSATTQLTRLTGSLNSMGAWQPSTVGHVPLNKYCPTKIHPHPSLFTTESKVQVFRGNYLHVYVHVYGT